MKSEIYLPEILSSLYPSNIYLCFEGIGTAFVEARVFKFFNKIAYSVYLTQFPIFFYNVGIQRHAEYYSPLLLVSIYIF